MVRTFGHDRVRVLDGGFPKWRAEGRPTENGPARISPAARPFATAFRPEMVWSTAEVLENLEHAEALILDARGPGRFEGREAEPRPGVRPGHIPGSRNLHYARLADTEDGTFQHPEGLARLFSEAGVEAGRPVVCSCGSGVTACALALGLEILGHGGVAVYDGSWSEWGTRTDTPVETGPAGP
jgi:thiosulfate/3-mercaptopyruvate sulfurtransferase